MDLLLSNKIKSKSCFSCELEQYQCGFIILLVYHHCWYKNNNEVAQL